MDDEMISHERDLLVKSQRDKYKYLFRFHYFQANPESECETPLQPCPTAVFRGIRTTY
jgi:hypothetical protein